MLYHSQDKFVIRKIKYIVKFCNAFVQLKDKKYLKNRKCYDKQNPNVCTLYNVETGNIVTLNLLYT